LGEYETLGGLILEIAENIPDVNTIISHPPFNFKILSLEDNRINTIEVKIDAK